MKCPECDGSGVKTMWVATDTLSEYKNICFRCHGKGEIEATKFDFIQTCTTEQLADVLLDFYLMGVSHGINGMDITPRTKFVEWLKQPYQKENVK